MKKLLVIRHSVANMTSFVGSDFNRELTHEGKELAAARANEIAGKLISVDKIISSPAVRALNTAKYFAISLRYDIFKIEQNESFYSQSGRHLVNILYKQDNTLDTIMIVGHNPAISSLISLLLGDFEVLHPCDVVAIEFNTTSWNEIGLDNSRLLYYDWTTHDTIEYK